MTVSAVVMDPRSQLPVVILKDEDVDHLVPIWIGVMEASAIAAALESVELPRPMTHDLLKSVVDELGAKLLRVDVVKIEDNTFYAQITVAQGGRIVEIDARPSDAIALAVRCGTEIAVARSVIETAGIRVEGGAPSGPAAEKLREILASLPDDLFGKWKM